MMIAYLILTHKDPEFTRRVAAKLTSDTENHVYVHVDAKVPIDDFDAALDGLRNVHVLRDRVAVYWGGFASIEATIRLLRTALESDCERFVLLQGLDYPVRSNSEIDEFFKRHSDVEFIRAASETRSRSNRDKHKYVLRHDMDQRWPLSLIRRKANAAVLRWWPFLFPAPHVRIDGKECEIYRGWAQFAVTQGLARYLVEFFDTHADFNRVFRRFYACDESYFHTIVYNSGFRSRTVDGGELTQESRTIRSLLNLTYFEYPDAVRVFSDASDLELLQSTGCLYFRKASTRGALLDRIDETHGR